MINHTIIGQLTSSSGKVHFSLLFTYNAIVKVQYKSFCIVTLNGTFSINAVHAYSFQEAKEKKTLHVMNVAFYTLT